MCTYRIDCLTFNQKWNSSTLPFLLHLWSWWVKMLPTQSLWEKPRGHLILLHLPYLPYPISRWALSSPISDYLLELAAPLVLTLSKLPLLGKQLLTSLPPILFPNELPKWFLPSANSTRLLKVQQWVKSKLLNITPQSTSGSFPSCLESRQANSISSRMRTCSPTPLCSRMNWSLSFWLVSSHLSIFLYPTLPTHPYPQRSLSFWLSLYHTRHSRAPLLAFPISLLILYIINTYLSFLLSSLRIRPVSYQ